MDLGGRLLVPGAINSHAHGSVVCPLFASGAPSLTVERVLANLIENALHYSPPGSRVVVRAEPGATELRLHVVDSGPGLPSAGGSCPPVKPSM